jgi:GDP-4-dehydro-6-deoxy-D-mannose reductase
MKGTALITGGAGFIGRHLHTALAEQGLRVVGVDLAGVGRPHEWDGDWFETDIRDSARVRVVMDQSRPDYVFHLAALTKSDSLSDLVTDNLIGTQSVLDAVVAACPKARVLVAGSSAEYGLVTADALPIREDHPLRPLSPYGLSKVAQGLLAAQYVERHGLDVVRTRTFNLTGPREPQMLVCSAFARQIVEIKLGRRPERIEVGNLASGRDFVDVRDAVRAYCLAAEKGDCGHVYNVCSGRSVTVRDVLATLMGSAGIDLPVHQVASRYSKWDVPIQMGAADKLFRLTGWTPGISLEQSLRDLLDDWYARLLAE